MQHDSRSWKVAVAPLLVNSSGSDRSAPTFMIGSE